MGVLFFFLLFFLPIFSLFFSIFFLYIFFLDYSENPKVDFSDCLIARRAISKGTQTLYSFESRKKLGALSIVTTLLKEQVGNVKERYPLPAKEKLPFSGSGQREAGSVL